jgi:LEA14-like dessication related protein
MNPTNQPLEVEGLVYDLEINGRTFARGVSDKAFTVPRLSEQTIEVTATGNLGGIVQQVMDIASGSRTRVDYRIMGRLVTKGSGRVAFDSKGNIPLPAEMFR